MGACCTKTQKLDLTRLDLTEVFSDYIWNKLYPEDVGKLKAAMTRRSKCKVEIRWEYLQKTSSTEWHDRAQDIDKEPEEPVCMHFAHYENSTGEEQKFSFGAERETVSSATFEFLESYTIGKEASIEIGIPDYLKIGAGVNEEVTMEKSNSKTFETRLQWSINSDISVNVGQKTKAEMKIVEKKTLSDFTVVSKMSYNDTKETNRRRLPYVIRDKDDNVLSVGSILNLEAPFRGRLPEKCEMVTFEDGGRTMVIRVSGTCKSITWQEQHVKVESEKLP
ncbi:uncharacterized protein [Haliotis asinina]|uniref:uncharacterized protein n=1 Tax=Haliotis asinina TaxID=109174 RepID=UPI0035326B13